MKKGFTLIEAMIVISLSALILLYIFAFVFISTKIYSRTVIRIEKSENIRSAADVIVKDIRIADEILSSSNSSRLMLFSDSKIILYEPKEGKIKRAVNGYAQYLTPEKTIKKLSFFYPGKNLIEVIFDPYIGNDQIIVKAAKRKQ